MTRRRKGSAAATTGLIAVGYLVFALVESEPAAAVVGAVIAVSAVIEYVRPGRGPLHPPEESTLQWLHKRRSQ